MLASLVQRTRFGLPLLLLPLVGCVTAFETDLGQFLPHNRSGWKRDEKYAPTFHTQLVQLQALREYAPTMGQAQQQRVSQEMSALVHNSANPLLRAEAIAVLAKIPTPDAAQALRVAFNDEDADVRIAACAAWGERGDADSLQMLSNVVRQDENVDVRIAAARALGKYPRWEAVEALGAALEDKDPALQHLAIQSLRATSGQDFGQNVPAWREYIAGRNPSAAQPTFAERPTPTPVRSAASPVPFGR